MIHSQRIIHILYISAALTAAYGLQCLQCSQSYFRGEPGFDICYQVENHAQNLSTCEMYSPDAYCFTKIEFSDGIISHLERGCTTTSTDVIHTQSYPQGSKCRTSYSSAVHQKATQQTECYYACVGDNCNSLSITDNLKSCPRLCPPNSECNYLTGKCQCSSNRSGDECDHYNPPVRSVRSCVQCNSKTNRGCANKTSGSLCQGSETLCSTTQTWIMNRNGGLVDSPLITRSCTGRYMSADRCYFTETGGIEVANYIEYTCVSTCSTDNCNIDTANGVIDGGEFIPMKCVVCDGDMMNCGPNYSLTSDCPVNTTHCLSTVTYWESSVNDSRIQGWLGPQHSVSIRRIERGCSSTPVEHECTQKKFGIASITEVTCRETCAEDGCNIGWPCRPKCVQCETETGKTSECSDFSSEAKYCPGPHHKYCYNNMMVWTTSDNDRGSSYQHTLTKRGCSATSEGEPKKCSNVTEYGGRMVVECVKYCSSDECNYAGYEWHSSTEKMLHTTTQRSSAGRTQAICTFLSGILVILIFRPPDVT